MAEITSLTAHRALTTKDCTVWKPKDLLLYFLKRIEDGEDFSGMAIAWVKTLPDAQICTGMHRAQLHCLECVGLLEAVKQDLLE
jgi:hypothetical protein